MANAWFETVAEAQRRAQKRLPKSVYGALVAGSEKGLSSRDNLDSFDQLGFAPHIAGLSGQRDMAVSVMGQQLSMPVIISPTPARKILGTPKSPKSFLSGIKNGVISVCV